MWHGRCHMLPTPNPTEFLLLVWYSNSQKRLDTKWSGFQMAFKYQAAQPFDYRTNRCHLVFFCTLFLYFCIQMAGQSLQTNHFKSELQKSWYLNAFGIQILIVLLRILVKVRWVEYLILPGLVNRKDLLKPTKHNVFFFYVASFLQVDL